VAVPTPQGKLPGINLPLSVVIMAPPACAGSSLRWENAIMRFVCPHCGTNAYRMLAGVDGKPAAECLNCGKASAFDQSMRSEPPEDGTRKPAAAKKQQRRADPRDGSRPRH
jgi:predicted RNA-binding Zn-ribbon protein involved in translation (DUF1610 family)